MSKKANKAKKSKAKRKPKPDASQTALAAVEKLIGARLVNPK
jgi:hypothetical protein